MERLFSLVKKEKVEIIIFEEFVSNPRKIYEEVLSFLNVPTDERASFPKVNEGKKVKWLWLQQVISLLINFALFLKTRIQGLSTKVWFSPKTLGAKQAAATQKGLKLVTAFTWS